MNEHDRSLKKIAGAIRSTINDHGPITTDLVGSAAKRVLGAFKADGGTPSMEWQPIASAPRDGTAVLVTDGQIQRVAWTQHPSEHGDRFNWCYHVTRGGAFTVMTDPTHWQPLPAAPSGETPEAQE